jgi:FkbM family methyltransferase
MTPQPEHVWSIFFVPHPSKPAHNMTFISYSQNFEDVLLWRALGHIKNGFYIDVGANDPVEHSVTNAFYERGWHGINIEPLPSFQQAFIEQRPRDINLAVAAGASESEISLFDVPAVNGWASNDKAVAEAHRAEGFAVVELTVPQRTLNAICEEHVRGDIHFLKIDVEGFEGEVLRGIDLTKWRPWILVVEATIPNSRRTNHETWEHLITAHNYHFAYFDGLNRYYVAGEQIQLRETISVQANVFDEFISSHLDAAWKATKDVHERLKKVEQEAGEHLQEAGERIQKADQRVQKADERVEKAVELTHSLDLQLQDMRMQKIQLEVSLNDIISSLNASLADISHHRQALLRELSVVYASRSWKITRPLRWLVKKIASLRSKKLAQTTSPFIPTEATLQVALVAALIQASEQGQITAAQDNELVASPDLHNMTLSARKTLSDLISHSTTKN